MSDLFGDLPDVQPPRGAPVGSTAAPGARPPHERLRGDRPLADRLRPQRLQDLVGQPSVFAEDAPLARMVRRKHLASLILWGPPGCGKTTLARLLAGELDQPLIALSAVMSGVADLRRAFDDARRYGAQGRRPILFIDEIHRFNRVQQDGLLHEVEDGTVTLVGATTENPSFALNAALVSRCHVVVLERLAPDALLTLINRAEAAIGVRLSLQPAARARLAELADGDGRYLLNLVESLADLPPEPLLDVEALGQVLSRRLPVYDKQQEAHYNLISALHKSVRGSDPDAALYWLYRMFGGGEDPRYIARRVVRMASEDIGLADPSALPQALAAAEAYERLGSPEGELMIAQAVVYLALAAKSNALYLASKAAAAAAKEHGSLNPPLIVMNAPTRLMRDLGYGQGYAYDHDAPDRFSGQSYFPPGMERASFYAPTGEGQELQLGLRLAELERLRAARQDPQPETASSSTSLDSKGSSASTQESSNAAKPSPRRSAKSGVPIR